MIAGNMPVTAVCSEAFWGGSDASRAGWIGQVASTRGEGGGAGLEGGVFSGTRGIENYFRAMRPLSFATGRVAGGVSLGRGDVTNGRGNRRAGPRGMLRRGGFSAAPSAPVAPFTS